MAGTLTNFAGATSFRFLTGDRFSTANSIRSTSNLHILNHNRNRNTPKASLHAVIDAPLVESMKQMSLYDVLNVKTNATASEIKSAYRRLAKRYHPDASGSNRNDDRDFIGIHDAYVTLSDPTSRALYDLKLSAGFERRSPGMYNGAGKSAGFYAGRRWETDQCW